MLFKVVLVAVLVCSRWFLVVLVVVVDHAWENYKTANYIFFFFEL